jgi:hypothetical protein
MTSSRRYSSTAAGLTAIGRTYRTIRSTSSRSISQRRFATPLAPIIEPFSAPGSDGPLYAEKDGVLRIFDTSQFIPAGFPQPRDLTIFGCSELSIDNTYSDVVAAKMVFSVPDVWDYTTNRITVLNVPIGNDPVSGEILFKLTVENFIQGRLYAVPGAILDEKLQFSFEYVRTTLEEIDVSREVLTNTFDKYSRPSISTIERWSRLPDGSGPDAFIGTNPDEREVQYFAYAQDPRKIGRQFSNRSHDRYRAVSPSTPIIHISVIHFARR